MAIALITAAAESTTTAVAAVAGKIIRIRKLMVSVNAEITFKSGTTTILPVVVTPSVRTFMYTFGADTPQTAVGEALNAANAAASDAGVWIAYDVVDGDAS